MPDFFYSEPSETQFNIYGPDKEQKATVDAVDVVEFFYDSKVQAQNDGDPRNWFTYFQQRIYKATNIKFSKTDAVRLINAADEIFQSIKKNGSEEPEPPNTSEPNPNSANETSSDLT